jgi:plastocyanin/uncharacterized membrane protein
MRISIRAEPRQFGYLFFGVAMALCLSSALAYAQAVDKAGATHVIIIKQMRFNPSELTVHPGDRIKWENQDIYAHTATADDKSFDSGLIEPGQSWTTTLSNAGTLGYHCRPHPNMTARIVVSATEERHQHEKNASLGWKPPRLPQEIHPILVNFTAALLPLAFLSDLLGKIFRRQSLHNAAWWMVAYGAAITPFTAAAGWWWKTNAGPDLPARLIVVHQWLGTAAAIFFVALALWRWAIQRRGVQPSTAYLAFAFGGVLALVYQGSLGGRMLFGS